MMDPAFGPPYHVSRYSAPKDRGTPSALKCLVLNMSNSYTCIRHVAAIAASTSPTVSPGLLFSRMISPADSASGFPKGGTCTIANKPSVLCLPLPQSRPLAEPRPQPRPSGTVQGMSMPFRGVIAQ